MLITLEQLEQLWIKYQKQEKIKEQIIKQWKAEMVPLQKQADKIREKLEPLRTATENRMEQLMKEITTGLSV